MNPLRNGSIYFLTFIILIFLWFFQHFPQSLTLTFFENLICMMFHKSSLNPFSCEKFNSYFYCEPKRKIRYVMTLKMNATSCVGSSHARKKERVKRPSTINHLTRQNILFFSFWNSSLFKQCGQAMFKYEQVMNIVHLHIIIQIVMVLVTHWYCNEVKALPSCLNWLVAYFNIWYAL